MATREYVKPCRVSVLQSEFISAGLALPSEFGGISCESGITLVYAADGLAQSRYDLMDAVVSDHHSAETLAEAKLRRHLELCVEVNAFLDSRYHPCSRSTMDALLDEAGRTGLANREAYLQTVLTWIKTVIAHYYTTCDAVNDCTTISQVNDVDVSLSQFVATDPCKTVRGALAIAD